MTLLDGTPYCIPTQYALMDGTVVFHCAHQGQKVDTLCANPHVCLAAACDVLPIPEDLTTKLAPTYWNDVLPDSEYSHIIDNPMFKGAHAYLLRP